MSQLRLQKRDDPLAINQDPPHPDPPASAHDQAATAGADNHQPAARRRATRRRTPATGGSQSRRRRTTAPAKAAAEERSYDEDRLEQTGWRIYESLLVEVRARADELTAEGIPTSAAALAAATLHSHLPRTIEDGAEVMRAYRQATAGRQRARRTT